MSRRQDYRLRSAIDSIHTQGNVFSSAGEVYSAVLCELNLLTDADFGFVLGRTSTSERIWQVLAANHVGEPVALGGIDEPKSMAVPMVSVGSWSKLFAQAIGEHVPQQFDATVDIWQSVLPHSWPRLRYLIVIPLIESQTTKALIGLMSDRAPFDPLLSKRLWPLLTCCLRVLRQMERRSSNNGVAETKPVVDYVANSVMQDSQQPIIELNENLRIRGFNKAAETIFSMSAKRAIGEEISFLLPEKFPNQHRIRTFVSTTENHLREMKNVIAAGANDDLFFVDVLYFSHQKNQQTYYTLLMSVKTFDEEESESQDSSAWLQLVRAAPVGMLYLDCQGRCQYANRLWRTITGLNAEQMMGHHWSDIPTLAHALDIDEYRAQPISVGGRRAQLDATQVEGGPEHRGKGTLLTLTVLADSQPRLLEAN